MSKDLDDISEQDLMAELERPDISAEDDLIYMKMLCAKRGITCLKSKGLDQEMIQGTIYFPHKSYSLPILSKLATICKGRLIVG